jgi:hypothetical protein
VRSIQYAWSLKKSLLMFCTVAVGTAGTRTVLVGMPSVALSVPDPAVAARLCGRGVTIGA